MYITCYFRLDLINIYIHIYYYTDQKMIQNKFILLLCLLHYYHNDAFYIPFSPSLFHKKHNHLLQANDNNELDNNDLEIDTISKSSNKILRLGRSKDQDGKSNIWSVHILGNALRNHFQLDRFRIQSDDYWCYQPLLFLFIELL